MRAARNVPKLDDWEGLFSEISYLDDSCMKVIGVVNYTETEARLDQIYAVLERINGRSIGSYFLDAADIDAVSPTFRNSL